MAVEEKALVKNLDYKVVTYGKRFVVTTKQFFANNHKIIIAKTGIGLVNAALSLMQIHEEENLDAILILGVGGALCPTLKEGDLVLATEVIQHDSLLSHENGNRLIATGAKTLSASDKDQVDPIIKCAKEFLSWLEKSFAKIDHSYTIHKGPILSGSEFVANSKRKKYLHENFEKALLVEMEAGAIAQIARRFEIPFVALKTVSDTAKPKTNVSNDYLDFLKSLEQNHANLLKIILDI